MLDPTIIDWTALEAAALAERDWRVNHYFDAETGRTLSVSDTVWRKLDAVYADFGEQAAEARLDSAEIRQAHAIAMDDSRYRPVPTFSNAVQREWQDDFAQRQEPALRRLLWRALDSDVRGQFERVLGLEPAVAAAWKAERSEQCRTALQDWLNSAH